MTFDFALFIAVSVLASESLFSEASPVYEECRTPTCQKTAQTLMEYMNTSADPCDNFYQYACGGWIDKNPIPDDKASYMAYEGLRDKVSERIVRSLSDVSDETHSRAVYDAASLYRGCVNEKAREAHGLDPLRSVMRHVGGWPIVEPGWNGDDYVWYRRIPEITRDFGEIPIVGVGVDIDANKTSQHVIYIVQPSFGLGRNQLVNTTSEHNKLVISAYKSYIVSVAKLLNPEAREDQLDRDASDIIAFERQLAQFTTPPEEKRSAKSWYHKMTVAEVQRKTESEKFQWTDFLNIVFKDYPKITEETEAVLTDAKYIKNAIKLASNTDRRILANYIGWVVLSNLGPHTTEEFRLTKFRFDKVRSGIQKPVKLERTCTSVVVSLMGFAVGRLYVNNYFTEAAKRDVVELVEDVRLAYRSTIENNDWMDKITTARALQKLNAIGKMMGYPQWILNDDDLNRYYETAKGLNSDEYFFSFRKATKSRLDYVLGKWNRPTNRTHEWRTSPAIVNAFYDPVGNNIIFPAAILEEPYYEYGRSPAWNFGALGGVIGHELSHGFDDQGSEFGPDGNLINWWTDETRAKFNEKADCFREQYSSYVEPTTNLRLNGNNTVGENIADNGGLRNSFLAFKRHRTQDGDQEVDYSLRDISLTPEQVFFVGRATAFCGSDRKEALAMKIQYDTHTPSQYRVVIPLTNLPEFAKAFDCPVGSPMNPEHKCNLW